MKILDTIKNRLKELSTYSGIAQVITSVLVIPEPTTQIIVAGYGILSILLPEKSEKIKIKFLEIQAFIQAMIKK